MKRGDTMTMPGRFDPRLALALLAGDACFVLANVALRLGWLHDPLWVISREAGYPERYQYVKELAVAALLAVAATRKRAPPLGPFSGLFLYFLLDDALAVHEAVGHAVHARLGLPGCVGELATHAAAGSAFLVALAISYRTANAAGKRVTRWLLGLTVAFGFFGGVVDALPELLPERLSLLRGSLGYLDDVGEMVVMSVVLAFVLGLRPLSRAPADASQGIPAALGPLLLPDPGRADVPDVTSE